MVEQLFTARREKGGRDEKEGAIVHREEEEKRVHYPLKFILPLLHPLIVKGRT